MESVFRKLCRLIHGDGPKVYKCISTKQTRNSDSNFYEAQPKNTRHVYLDDRCTAQTIIKTPAERTAVKNPIENITSTQTHQKKKIYILENRNRTKNKEKLEKRKYNENDGYKKKHKNGLLPLLFKVNTIF
ncbi:uncharacterized protein LOC132720275 [Ruditapes philippinarum]|uniref:uncharacterized protein LOC132720275 n=1 Tax=Ruditapes philippinarum TaxID=129788 RepID=UPI00295AD3B5|nr:uncharacterized protein LOC132720275 [Ruditapes philippinarum]